MPAGGAGRVPTVEEEQPGGGGRPVQHPAIRSQRAALAGRQGAGLKNRGPGVSFGAGKLPTLYSVIKKQPNNPAWQRKDSLNVKAAGMQAGVVYYACHRNTNKPVY